MDNFRGEERKELSKYFFSKEFHDELEFLECLLKMNPIERTSAEELKFADYFQDFWDVINASGDDRPHPIFELKEYGQNLGVLMTLPDGVDDACLNEIEPVCEDDLFL